MASGVRERKAEIYDFVTVGFMNDLVAKYPKPLNELGEFVYYRTYSRWLPEKKRREFWFETVRRATNYNFNLVVDHLKSIGYKMNYEKLRNEAELFAKNMYLTKQFLSGRTLWVGGANEIINERFVLGNFNCSYISITKWEDLCDLFYLLMVGTGVGFKNTKAMAKKMPKIRINTTLLHSEYKPVPKLQRLEHTKLTLFENGFAKIYVGDSKEGWVDALRKYLEILTLPEYEHIHTIKISYNSIRPKGERLKTFGGTASGHEPLREMFEGFDKVLKNEIDKALLPIEQDEKGYGNVRPIHILDMGNLIGANVVVGGVRRTSEIFLMDNDDYESMLAKYGINGFWSEENFEQHNKVRQALIDNKINIPDWFDNLSEKQYVVYYNKKESRFFRDKEVAEEFASQYNDSYVHFPANAGRTWLNHRRMSNNSVAFNKKPTRKQLNLQFELLQGEGEPCFVNLEEALRRRPNAEGLNPCVEIILASYGVCNLTTINVVSFVYYDEALNKFVLDEDGLFEAQRMSARAGLRMTLAKLELPHWNEIQQRDRLLGCSLTGWKDAMALLGYSDLEEKQLQELLGIIARREADEYAKELRVNAPLLVTAVKPEGTISQLCGGVSSGLHWSHSPYYIRRIRINSNDSLVKVAIKLGWNVNPEVGTEGETFEERMDNAKTLVIDFPVYSGSNETKDDVSAKRQLETYFSFQERYTEHNSSNTITVRPEEWKECEHIIWDNWDNFVGVSFLQLDGGTYQLAPYEAITKEKYDEMKSNMKPFDVSILHELEKDQDELGSDLDGADSCEGNICPIR